MKSTEKTISIKDAIYIGTLLISLGTVYGVTSNRMSNIESRLIDISTRYEREVVPRSEHIQMNAVLDQRLQAIMDSQRQSDKQIEQMQLKLDTILQKR